MAALRAVVLGVGNGLLGDDGVGLRVAERVRALLPPGSGVEVRTSERGGMDLVDLLAGAPRAVVVDSFVLEGAEPGTVVEGALDDFAATRHLFGAHGIDLPTALALGRAIGADMPERVLLVGVVPEDPYTMHEGLTPAVEAAVEPAARVVLEMLGIIGEAGA